MDEEKEKQFESVTESELKKHGVDLNTIKFKGLKPLKKEWYEEIIEINIKNLKVKPLRYNKNNNSFTFEFEDFDGPNLFHENFCKEIFRSTNNFLISKELNVKNYNRILVFEVSQSDRSLTLTY